MLVSVTVMTTWRVPAGMIPEVERRQVPLTKPRSPAVTGPIDASWPVDVEPAV